MKAIKPTLKLLGVALGLSAAIAATGCGSDKDDADASRVSEGPSTGVPPEVAEQFDATTRQLEADALSDANVQAKPGSGEADSSFATRSTGVPEEVAESFERNHQQFEADALQDADIRVKRPDADTGAPGPAGDTSSAEPSPAPTNPDGDPADSPAAP